MGVETMVELLEEFQELEMDLMDKLNMGLLDTHLGLRMDNLVLDLMEMGHTHILQN